MSGTTAHIWTMELCTTIYYHTFQRLSQAHFVYIHGGCRVKYSICMLLLIYCYVMYDYMALLHVVLDTFYTICYKLMFFDVCS